MPFTEDIQSEALGEKFGVPNPNHLSYGLVFWELSQFNNQAPYAFQWEEGVIDVWNPNGENITQYRLKLVDCPALYDQLDKLLDAIAESAKIMMADKVRNNTVVFAGSPTWYRVKYNPPDMLGNITLRNIEFFQAPWIAEAKTAKAMIAECLNL